MSGFPVTSVTLIAKIKELSPGEDSAAWVRFWDTYSLAICQFAAMKGGEDNADDIVMVVLGKLVDVLREDLAYTVYAILDHLEEARRAMASLDPANMNVPKFVTWLQRRAI